MEPGSTEPDSSQPEVDPATTLRATWQLWLALFGGVVLLAAAAGTFVGLRGPFLVDAPPAAEAAARDVVPAGSESEGSGTGDSGTDSAVGTVLGVLAILIVGMAFIVPSMVRSPVHAPPAEPGAAELARRLGEFRRRSLLGWALAEGAANLACLAIFLVGFGPLTLTALLLFAVQMLMTAPTGPRVREALA